MRRKARVTAALACADLFLMVRKVSWNMGTC